MAGNKEHQMGDNNKTQTITIDDKDYKLEDFTPEQRVLLDHCVDLDRKLASCQFQFDQLRVGKEAFLSMLKKSLEAQDVIDIKEEQ
jgi:hypothetical protein